MGYYLRVLGLKDIDVPLSHINAAFKAKNISVSIESDGAKSAPWTEIILSHTDGPAICHIERNPVLPGELGETELAEFVEKVSSEKPKSAARWLSEYLPKVKVIYAVQKLSGADVSFGWGAIGAALEAIQKTVGGIIHADYEGFSNEAGYHILWQFSSSVMGDRWMAVLDDHGNWLNFKMDLGNPEHRKAFQGGKVPSGVSVV